MKRKGIRIFLAIGLLTLIMSGCSKSAIKSDEMFIAPTLSESSPEKVTNVIFPLPTKLDVADSAFLSDLGINTPSYSWKAIEWRKEKNGKWEVVAEWTAVRLEIPNEKPSLIVSIPREKKEHLGNLIAVVDHSGKRFYNRRGQQINDPKGWRKTDPNDYSGFFSEISDNNAVEFSKGTADYTGLMDYYKQYIALEAMQKRDSIYIKHGISLGTTLTDEQLKRISDDPAVDKIKDFFFDKWYMLFTYPLLSPVDYGAYIFIAKVFQIPSIWWKDDLNQPGYMDRTLTAAAAFDMMDYYANKYRGFVTGGGGVEKLLPPELKQTIKEVHGKDFTTYDEYNAWVVEQNNQ